jgi:hypothetical protein
MRSIGVVKAILAAVSLFICLPGEVNAHPLGAVLVSATANMELQPVNYYYNDYGYRRRRDCYRPYYGHSNYYRPRYYSDSYSYRSYYYRPYYRPRYYYDY